MGLSGQSEGLPPFLLWGGIKESYLMAEENEVTVRPGLEAIGGEGNPNPADELAIPDYAMLDFGEDFVPSGKVRDARVREAR
jgi:hypothetical protein